MKELQHISHIIIDPHIHTDARKCTVSHIHVAVSFNTEKSGHAVSLYECYVFDDVVALDCIPDVVLADSVRWAQVMVNYCLVEKGVRIL